MEYKLSTGSWTDIGGTTVTNLVPGTYYVRIKETDTTKASEQVTAIVTAFVDLTKYTITVNGGHAELGGVEATESSKGLIVTVKAENIPNGYDFDKWVCEGVSFVDATSETTTFTMPAKNVTIEATYKSAALTGTATISGDKVFGATLTASLEASNNTGVLSYQWYRGATPIDGATNQTYTLTAQDVNRSVKVEVTSDVQTGSIMSSATTAIQKATASAPMGISTTACTTVSNNDGTITGVTTAMEYSADGTVWNDCEGTTVASLANGTYYVRFKETETHLASSHATVVVNAYEAPAQYGITVECGTSNVNIAEEGVEITVTAGTAPTGKQFDKWVSTDVTFADANSETTTFTMPANNVIVTATYKNVQYTLTFDANGGTGSMDSVNKDYDEQYVLPTCTFTAPDGKEFKCWEVDSFEMNVGESIRVTEDLTIKAVWKDCEVATFEVIFDANGGIGSMVKVDTNGEYTLPANTITAPEGKQFKCWDVDGEEKAVGDKINVTKNTTIKAVWESVKADDSETRPTDSAEKKEGGLSGGAIAGITTGSVVIVAASAYFALGFTLYKKGKLTGKFFTTIFKWIKK